MRDSDQGQQSSTRSHDERLYRICMFEPGGVVPRVQLVSAAGDEQVVALALTIDPLAEREVWDHHRLVAHIPARHPARERHAEPVDLN